MSVEATLTIVLLQRFVRIPLDGTYVSVGTDTIDTGVIVYVSTME